MRILLATLFIFLNYETWAIDEKSISDLFSKYDQLMDDKKIDLIDELFTEKFIKDNGGRDEFIKKIKQLSYVKNKKPSKIKWKEGRKKNRYLVKLNDLPLEFIVVEENKKIKIDETIGDED